MTDRINRGDRILINHEGHVVSGVVQGIFSETPDSPPDQWVLEVKLDTLAGQTVDIHTDQYIEKTDQIIDGRSSHDAHRH